MKQISKHQIIKIIHKIIQKLRQMINRNSFKNDIYNFELFLYA